MLFLIYIIWFGEKVLALVTVATAILHIWRGRGRYMVPIFILLAVAGALFGMQIVVEEAPVNVAGSLMLARFCVLALAFICLAFQHLRTKDQEEGDLATALVIVLGVFAVGYLFGRSYGPTIVNQTGGMQLAPM